MIRNQRLEEKLEQEENAGFHEKLQKKNENLWLSKTEAKNIKNRQKILYLNNYEEFYKNQNSEIYLLNKQKLDQNNEYLVPP